MRKIIKKAIVLLMGFVMILTVSMTSVKAEETTETFDALTNLNYIIAPSVSTVEIGTVGDAENSVYLGGKRTAAVYMLSDGAYITNIATKAHKYMSPTINRAMTIYVGITDPTTEPIQNNGYDVYTSVSDSGVIDLNATAYTPGMDLTEYCDTYGNIKIAVFYHNAVGDAVLESLTVTRNDSTESYTVEFKDVNGETFSTTKVPGGSSVTLPTTNPTKENALFYGWVTADGEEFTAGTPIRENIVAYPKFLDLTGDYIKVGTDVTVAYAESEVAVTRWNDGNITTDVNERGRYVLDAGEGNKIQLSSIYIFGIGTGEFQFWGSDELSDGFVSSGDTSGLTSIKNIGLANVGWSQAELADAEAYRYVYMSLKYQNYRDKAREILLYGDIIAPSVITVDGKEYSFEPGQVVRAASDKAGVWKVNDNPVAYGKTLVYSPNAGDVVTFVEDATVVSISPTAMTADTFTTAEIEAGSYTVKLIASDGATSYAYSTTTEVAEAGQYQYAIEGMPSGTSLTYVELVAN